MYPMVNGLFRQACNLDPVNISTRRAFNNIGFIILSLLVREHRLPHQILFIVLLYLLGVRSHYWQ